jgi:hypothetical protein
MRKRVIRAAGLSISAAIASCGTGDPTTSAGAWPLLEDRTIEIETRLEDGTYERVTVPIADGTDATATALLAAVRSLCDREIGPRFTLDPEGPTPPSMCGVDAAYEQQVNLCAAHQYLGFAEAIAPTDIFVDTQRVQIPS